MSKKLAKAILISTIVGVDIPGIIEKSIPRKYKEVRPCLNQCGRMQTPGLAFCSAECCKEYREKMKKKRKANGKHNASYKN